MMSSKKPSASLEGFGSRLHHHQDLTNRGGGGENVKNKKKAVDQLRHQVQHVEQDAMHAKQTQQTEAEALQRDVEHLLKDNRELYQSSKSFLEEAAKLKKENRKLKKTIGKMEQKLTQFEEQAQQRGDTFSVMSGVDANSICASATTFDTSTVADVGSSGMSVSGQMAMRSTYGGGASSEYALKLFDVAQHEKRALEVEVEQLSEELEIMRDELHTVLAQKQNAEREVQKMLALEHMAIANNTCVNERAGDASIASSIATEWAIDENLLRHAHREKRNYNEDISDNHAPCCQCSCHNNTNKIGSQDDAKQGAAAGGSGGMLSSWFRRDPAAAAAHTNGNAPTAKLDEPKRENYYGGEGGATENSIMCEQLSPRRRVSLPSDMNDGSPEGANATAGVNCHSADSGLKRFELEDGILSPSSTTTLPRQIERIVSDGFADELNNHKFASTSAGNRCASLAGVHAHSPHHDDPHGGNKYALHRTHSELSASFAAASPVPLVNFLPNHMKRSRWGRKMIQKQRASGRPDSHTSNKQEHEAGGSHNIFYQVGEQNRSDPLYEEEMTDEEILMCDTSTDAMDSQLGGLMLEQKRHSGDVDGESGERYDGPPAWEIPPRDPNDIP
jgi:hypothetical protein